MSLQSRDFAREACTGAFLDCSNNTHREVTFLSLAIYTAITLVVTSLRFQSTILSSPTWWICRRLLFNVRKWQFLNMMVLLVPQITSTSDIAHHTGDCTLFIQITLIVLKHIRKSSLNRYAETITKWWILRHTTRYLLLQFRFTLPSSRANFHSIPEVSNHHLQHARWRAATTPHYFRKLRSWHGQT